MRYYYKSKDGKGLLNLKSPLVNDEAYIEITEAEFNALQPQPHVATQEEIRVENIRNQIAFKKAQLASTDYKCMKYVDGALTEEEYAPIKAQRQTLRDEINELEESI